MLTECWNTAVLQHSVEPRKSFLHTKYLASKSIVFLLLISRGSHSVTVCCSDVTYLVYSCLLITLLMMSSLWSLMMSASHVTALLTELKLHQSPCSLSAQRWDLRPPWWPSDRQMRRRSPVLDSERGVSSEQCISWHRNIDTGQCQHPGSGPWPCSPGQPPTQLHAAHLRSQANCSMDISQQQQNPQFQILCFHFLKSLLTCWTLLPFRLAVLRSARLKVLFA